MESGNEIVLYAIDGKTGATKWSKVFGPGYKSDPVVGSDGTIYTEVDDAPGKYFCAIQSTTGKIKWRLAIDVDTLSEPALGADGTIYILSNYVQSGDHLGSELLAIH